MPSDNWEPWVNRLDNEVSVLFRFYLYLLFIEVINFLIFLYILQDSKINVSVMCLQLISNEFILLTVLLNMERNMTERDFSFRAISIFNWLTGYHLLFIKTLRFGVLVFPVPGWAWDFSYKNVLNFSLANSLCRNPWFHFSPPCINTTRYTFFPISDSTLPKVFSYRRCFFTPVQARTTMTFCIGLLFSLWQLILNEIIRCPSWTFWLSGLKFDINMVRNLPEEEVAVA